MLTACGIDSNATSGSSGDSKPASASAQSESNSSSSASVDKGKGRVGVAMPTKDLQRWNQDGENMKSELEKAGYTVDLQYANNDIGTQVSQMETLISNGADVLVIASVDGESLGDPLSKAKEAGIPVIAYYRLFHIGKGGIGLDGIGKYQAIVFSVLCGIGEAVPDGVMYIFQLYLFPVDEQMTADITAIGRI